MSVNQVHLLGRCCQDPEIRTVGQNNVNRATFSLCTGEKYKTRDGREVDDTAWHNIVAWRGLADMARQHIRKGSQLFIIGHLSYRRYTDSNGVEKYITEIIAERIELCGRAGSKSPVVIEAQPPKPTTSPMQDSIGDLPPDDDWPF